MNILEMHDIHKSYNDLEVLKGIDLTVAKGEVVAVIGPSGGGKSTLLRCATILERIDSGKIVIGGDVLCDTKDEKIHYCDKKMMGEIKSKFGLVFQNFNLFPHFSVRRNITEALIHVHKKTKLEADIICDELLLKMDLVEKLTLIHATFRAASSREYPSQELLPQAPTYCSSMSRHPHWILSLPRAS